MRIYKEFCRHLFSLQYMKILMVFWPSLFFLNPTFAASKLNNLETKSIEYPMGISPYSQRVPAKGLPNELGMDEAISYVSDLKAYWSYVSLHYYHPTDKGTFGGRINAAHRFGTTAVQYEAEAYPILFNNAYAALNFAYANTSQTLFASYQYRAEAYLNLRHGYEISLGQGGQFFPQFNHKKIYVYTGSFGKYFSHYFIWLRSSYYTPRSNLLTELGLRRTFNNKNNYIGIRASLGHLPDIGDLPPVDQLLTVSQKAVGLTGQIYLKHNIFTKIDISYAHQVYPAGLIRNITAEFISLFIRF